MNQSAKFWDKLAKGYAKQPVADEQAYQQKLKLTQTYLEPQMEVMEFGCGTGSTAIFHAPFVEHILATDISSKMLEIARAKAEAADLTNVDFVQTTLDELDVPDAHFDVIMGHSILHLMEDKEAAMARVRDLLKAGGVFVTSTVCIGDKMAFLKFLLPIARFLRVLPFIGVLKQDQLIDSFKSAGFEIDQQWRPDKSSAVFVIAKKPGNAAD